VTASERTTHVECRGCWGESTEHTCRSGVYAVSTTASAEDLDDGPAYYVWYQSIPHQATGWSAHCQMMGYEAWKERGRRDTAQIQRLTEELTQARRQRSADYQRGLQDGLAAPANQISRLQTELDDAKHEHQIQHPMCSATPASCSHETQLDYVTAQRDAYKKVVDAVTAVRVARPDTYDDAVLDLDEALAEVGAYIPHGGIQKSLMDALVKKKAQRDAALEVVKAVRRELRANRDPGYSHGNFIDGCRAAIAAFDQAQGNEDETAG